MKVTLVEWQNTYKHFTDLIIQASSINCDDSWQSFPIGMCWQYAFNFRKGESIQIGKHENTVFCAISPSTDSIRRPNGINRQLILENLNKNGIANKFVDHFEYFDTLPKYKFVVSPEGNGIDCHRHYESLIAGCIPIIEHNHQIEDKYKGCPILFTRDYSEITQSYLNKKYEDMKNRLYDFSCLFMHNYNKETQQMIKNSGNFWLSKYRLSSFISVYK